MRILVGVDQSPESHDALRYVCHLMDHFDAEVDALHVRRDAVEITLESFDVPFVKKEDPGEWIEARTREVEEQIADACQICLAGKVPCQPRVVVGEATDQILHTAREGDYDLIVLGSQGFSSLKGFLLGSVHSKVLHHASCPVLIVRQYREIRRILVAYRGSRCEQAALSYLAPLAIRRRPKITVLHVQETALAESDGFAEACLLQGRDTLVQHGLSPATIGAKGEFVEETLREIVEGGYDLVVLGAYGHERPQYLKVISDEALQIVSKTHVPVLVFRDSGEE